MSPANLTTGAAPLLTAIEPLVSYICAADYPRAALASALRALQREVEQTNRLAERHLGRTASLPKR